MSFLLSPASLAWLGLLAPLILLYVLKRRRERRVVGSTLLWEAALRDMRAERPWRRLVPHLSLLLQALVLIAGAIALARPSGGAQVPAGARLALVIDVSASMAARDEGRVRIEAARASALALARALPPGGEMMIVEAGPEATVLMPPSADLAALDGALRALQVRGTGADLEGAVALAAERLRAAPAGSRIVLLTDGASEGEIVLSSGVPVEVQRVGAPDSAAQESSTANTAIVAVDVRARPTPSAPDRAEIFVRVAHYGPGTPELYVSASVEGRGMVASRRIQVGQDEPESLVLTADLPPDESGQAAVVRVELSAAEGGSGTGDALDLDDVAVAPSPGARRLPVILVGDAPASLRRVLLADRDVELFASTVEALSTRRREHPDEADLDGLIVYVGQTPQDAPPGDSVVFAPTGAVFGIEIGDEVSAPQVVSWEEGDPRLRFVSFRDVHVQRARPLLGAAARPLVSSDAGALLATVERPDGETTLVGFDPDASDWPRRPSFVIFVRNLLERARARRAQGGIEAGSLGDALRVPAPDGAEVRVVAPDGSSHSAIARGGLAIVPVPALPGVYRAQLGRRELHALRNLLSPGESDVRPRARFVTREGGAEVSATQSREPTEAWPWLAALLLLVLALEATWATRKAATA